MLLSCNAFEFLTPSDWCCASAGCRQHGRPPQQVLCYSAGPEAQTGGHPGLGLHGEGALDPVLQIDPLQADQDHLLQGRSVRGTVQTGRTVFFLSFFAEILHLCTNLNKTPYCQIVYWSSLPVYFCAGAVLRAAGHQGGLHQSREGIPAGDHLHCGPETPSHTSLLCRSQRAGELTQRSDNIYRTLRGKFTKGLRLLNLGK